MVKGELRKTEEKHLGQAWHIVTQSVGLTPPAFSPLFSEKKCRSFCLYKDDNSMPSSVLVLHFLDKFWFDYDNLKM